MTTNDNAKSQAEAQMASIMEMVSKLRNEDDPDGQEEAAELIQEDPLSVLVRDGWRSPGAPTEDGPEEYEILLCTGGPAVRIHGELNQWNEPRSARIEYQDWFQPWKELEITQDQEDALMVYAQQFYYGE